MGSVSVASPNPFPVMRMFGESQESSGRIYNLATLRYARRLEREYQRDYAMRYLTHMRIALVVGVLNYVSFGYLDYVMSPGTFPTIVEIRYFIATPLLLLPMALLFTRFGAYLSQPLILFASNVATISVLIIQWISWADTGQYYYVGLILINLFTQVLARLQFVWATAAIISNTLFFELLLWFLPSVDVKTIAASHFFILGAVGMGFVVSYMFELQARRDFLASRSMNSRHKELLQQSHTDPLTGILNRRGLLERLDQERARCQRYEHGFVVALLDVDHFKSVNDNCGHACGDLLLRNLAGIIKDTCRSTDITGRWGGEEFLLLLPETSLNGARRILEELRKRVADEIFEHDGKRVPVSVSIGFTECDGNKEVSECIREADMALYECKRLGRNRVMSWQKLPRIVSRTLF